MAVYYVPFEVTTTVPVTPANIEREGRRCTLSSASEETEVLALLDSTDRGASGRSFNSKGVRAEFVDTTGWFERMLALVDSQGVVRRGDRDEALSGDAMGKLKTILDRACMTSD